MCKFVRSFRTKGIEETMFDNIGIERFREIRYAFLSDFKLYY